MVPVTPRYPGVYVEELPVSQHVVTAASTSDTAFVGVFERGPVDRPQRVTNLGEFTRIFGRLDRRSRASYGIGQFFENGGAAAAVVRIRGIDDATAAGATDHVALDAIGPGTWGNRIEIATQPADGGGFDLVVRELSDDDPGTRSVVSVEMYRWLDTVPGDSNFVGTILNRDSMLVTSSATQPKRTRHRGRVPSTRTSILDPRIHGDATSAVFAAGRLTGGKDGLRVGGPSSLGTRADASTSTAATGMYTLDSISPLTFNILCIPAMAAMTPDDWTIAYRAGADYCRQHLACFIADPPVAAIAARDVTGQVREVQAWWSSVPKDSASDYAAVYFPRIEIADPSTGDPFETETSGTLAGIYARTDAQRGVWKAPAGSSVVLSNVVRPVVRIDDEDNGTLNQLGINCLRSFDVGTVSWGARTVNGAEALDSQWKYVNVRRLVSYIEMSVKQSISWATFQPNDESLWGSLRLTVDSFLADLFRQGALAGSTAREAYFVKCDATTTTPQDIRNGLVNIRVGVAPISPADFVVIDLSQLVAT